ncbi:MAG: YihY/virulence factor BrkB family protein [Lachnospiraceae bacterium]|jgi:membrane protein|nr:YihY/virulence factor BrkB family protein [Lachnospiraceae bacterium]
MKKAIAVLKEVLRELRKDNVGAFAAQTTFFLMVSAIPALILFVFIFQHTALREYQLLTLINTSFPKQVAPFLVSIVHEMYRNSPGVFSVALIGALWSSGNGVQVLANGLNVIYGIEENRQWVVLRIRAIFYTLIFSIGILMTIVGLIFGDLLRKRMLPKYPIFGAAIRFVLNIRFLVLFVIFLILFLFILKFLPNRKATFKGQLPASIGASAAWVVMSYLIAIYVEWFDGFSMYGSMTTLMLIMMYVYFGVYILLICAELDSLYKKNLLKFLRKIRNKRKT